MTVATGGGMFIDGFVFATISAALAGSMVQKIGVTSTWTQLISASTLIGTFFGGIVIGRITDLKGRRPMFTIDLCVFLLAALSMFLVNAPWQVFIIGIVMGLAVGGDYSIGSPLLAEFAPNRSRGNYLGLLEILWNVGYVVAYLIGYVIDTYWASGWHVLLAASAVPAIICLCIRHGLPESPRWLATKGRVKEAEEILREAVGDKADIEDLHESDDQESWQLLFHKDYRRRTIFVCTFWSAIVLPYFAITFIQPEILKDLGVGGNTLLDAAFGTAIALCGAGVGWFLVDKVGRRPLLIIPFILCAVCLGLDALDTRLPIGVRVVLFFGYLFFYGNMSILTGIYPDEVYPTQVRTSGVGLSSACSRAGAAIGTFLLSPAIHHIGLGPSLLILGGVSAIGGVTSFFLAPETNGQDLSVSGHRDPVTSSGKMPAAA